ncbi:hypothetical protein [Haladaptatus caseinilyticus]|uniref:hypothetical protein n=1 Tax=Haladaptatus caseinilyticus TaxID=2993314 RepID=UPI00224AE903|nr:hypothetical protein [Haladaptatus caseinilyticus]
MMGRSMLPTMDDRDERERVTGIGWERWSSRSEGGTTVAGNSCHRTSGVETGREKVRFRYRTSSPTGD